MPDQFDWAAHTEAVAADIFGEPNAEMSRPPEDVRYGNHGSVSINFTTGIWYDHENERGGGIKELIRVYKEIDDRDAAIAYAEECQQNFENGAKPLPKGNSKGRQNSQLELEAIYSYLDASGSIAFEVLRYLLLDPVSKNYIIDARGKRIKTFSQRRPSGEPDGSRLWGLDAGEYMRQAPGKNWYHFNAAKFEQYPATRQRKVFPNAAPVIPYRLPELLKATAASQTICIAEGEKKVDLIRGFKFPATCCAGGAKKWPLEHSAFFKEADVVLLPDNDTSGQDHVNLIAESLRASGAKRIRILKLPNLSEKDDVVDWHAAGGTAEEFAHLIDAAPDYIPDETAGPQPLMRPLPPPEPFPLDALGDELASAAQAIRDIVQSPIEMCISGVLASTSFAISAHINIKLPTGEIKPTSCWFWLIAISGERKTAVDERAFSAQDQREQQLHARSQVELEEYEVRCKMWEAQAKAIEKDFKKTGEAGSEAHRIELEKLGGKPLKPLDSLLKATDFTIEGLEDCLDFGQPLYGIIGAEGGQFIGGHGMAKDAKLRTITGLCQLWDGKAIKKARSGRIKLLFNRRAGMHLMIQPEVADIAFVDELLTTQGFLSRILVCRPESLIGTRLHKNPPAEAEPTLQNYQRRILDILEMPYPLVSDRRNELKPRAVKFSAEAEQLFWKFHDECEKAMIEGGEYESIRRFTAKLPEHAARLSTTIAAYKDINLTELSSEDFLRGMQIAIYYAHEAKRISGPPAISSELLPMQELLPPAKKLLDWLRDWTKDTVTARDIYTYGPNSIRNQKSAITLAEVLVEHGWLTPIKTRRNDTKKWQITKGPEQ
jgi:hypothetical protein